MLLKFHWSPSTTEVSAMSRNEPFKIFKSFKFQVDSMIEHETSFWSLELHIQPSRANDKITAKLRLENTSITKYLQTRFTIAMKSKQGNLLGQIEKLHLFKKSSDELSENDIFIQNGVLRSSFHYCPFNIVCNITTNIENEMVKDMPGVIFDFEKLLNDQQFSDFTVITPNDKKFHVHKNILAARSKVFSALFNSDMVENKQNSMIIKAYDDQVIQELLRYIYCGKVENLEIISSPLCNAAEQYMLEGLKIMCLEQMCDAVTYQNAIQLLCLTVNFKVDFLKSRILNFIIYHIKEIDKTDLDCLDESVVREILLKTVETHL